MRGRRSRLRTVMDILAVLEERGPLPLSRLATHANLPYDRAKRIVEYLEERGLVELRRGSSTITVSATPRGLQLLDELRRLQRLLGDLGLDI